MSVRVGTTLVAVLLLAALPLSAGYHYQAVTTTEGDGGMGDLVVEGWVSGDRAKVLFKEAKSDQPFLGKGSYLLTRDGGSTVYLVNPEKRTYSEWDMGAMVQSLGAMMEALGGLATIELSDPEVTKLSEEPGPTMLGMPTRHLKFRTSYSISVRVMGMGSTMHHVDEEEIWVTETLEDAAFRVWLQGGLARTGHEELDRLIRAQIGKVDGVPLKYVSVSTITDERSGRPQTTRTATEVTKLERTSVPDSTFELPQGYEQTPLLPEMPNF